MGFFLTVQLDNFVTLSECVLCFGFDLCFWSTGICFYFRTTGHDPWFDFVERRWTRAWGFLLSFWTRSHDLWVGFILLLFTSPPNHGSWPMVRILLRNAKPIVWILFVGTNLMAWERHSKREIMLPRLWDFPRSRVFVEFLFACFHTHTREG